MREAVERRIKRLEKARGANPHAIVTFSDGHRERLDIHRIAVAFFERNKAGIVSLEWESPTDEATIYELLACPDVWERLSNERIEKNE
ncbi:MAG: hypothetical protein E7422_08235 [Ruminococcaceae bacterium]|nr:hypothetical protein [Oscillospiraceae bacterium]